MQLYLKNHNLYPYKNYIVSIIHNRIHNSMKNFYEHLFLPVVDIYVAQHLPLQIRGYSKSSVINGINDYFPSSIIKLELVTFPSQIFLLFVFGPHLVIFSCYFYSWLGIQESLQVSNIFLNIVLAETYVVSGFPFSRIFFFCLFPFVLEPHSTVLRGYF